MQKKIKVMINTPHISKPGGVASFYKSLKGKFEYDVSYNYIGGRSKSKLAPFYMIADYFAFILRIIIRRPDIIHINPSLDKKAVIRDGIFLMIAKATGRKVLVSWHGWSEKFQEEVSRKHEDRFINVFNRADVFTVLCSDFKKRLTEWGITKPVILETTLFDDDLIKDFRITEKIYKKRILFISRVERSKGVFKVLEAFSRLDQDQYTLTIAGTGSDLENAKLFSKENNLKNVIFPGYVEGSEKINTLKDHDVYILLSDSEGMPLSTLEAMAFGLAVITTPAGGVKDFFEDGKMGYLTDAADPVLVSKIIEKLCSDPVGLKKISEYNAVYAVSRFRASGVAKRFEKIYEEMMK